MARKTSTFEDILESVALLPWWGGLIVTFLVWTVGHAVVSSLQPPEGPAGALYAFFPLVVNLFALACLVGSLKSAFDQINRRQLLAKQTGQVSLQKLSWRNFEVLVGEAYRQQGYFVEETQRGPDGGVDLRLSKDGVKTVVQCKRWRNRKVGVATVRELYGVMTDEDAQGILACSGRFTEEAKRFAKGKPIELLDGNALARLIATVQGRELPEPEESTTPACPKCGAEMILRTARKGKNSGKQFYGCSSFPKCRGTLDL